MAHKLQYTYCKNCGNDMRGVVKFCDMCGESENLMVYEKEYLPETESENYSLLPSELRGLYVRVSAGDAAAMVEWGKLVYKGDPRLVKDEYGWYDTSECVNIFSEAYKLGNPEAAYMLGKCYQTGCGERTPFNDDAIEPDPLAAFLWYERAAQGNFYPAYAAMGKLTEENEKRSPDKANHRRSSGCRIQGIPASLDTAAHYYKVAALNGVKEGKTNYERLKAKGYEGFEGVDY